MTTGGWGRPGGNGMGGDGREAEGSIGREGLL